MLAPPGSGANRNPGARRTTAKAESPDDVIRKLQKLPPNKKCADCSSKLPSYVNLTVSSFVCMQCAGIHRELSARVKGVGHSSFTAEEATQMKSMDNEKVNLMWLARYNPRVERMQAPTDNTNQHQLKSWIFRKYNEKQWYAEPGSDGAVSGGGGGAPPPPVQRQQSRSRNAAAPEPQPTMVQLPPAAREQHPVNSMDLFGGGGGAAPDNPPTSSAADDHAFPADFGSVQARSAFPGDQPLQQAPPDKFANFDAHTAAAPPQQPEAPSFANFDAPSPPPAGAGGSFANFDAPNPPPAGAGGGFANFDQQHNLGHQASPSLQQNFGHFPAEQQQNSHQVPPQQQKQNFGQFPTEPKQQNQPPKPPPRVGEFGGFHSPTREASPRPVAAQSPALSHPPQPPSGKPPLLPAMDHAASDFPSLKAATSQVATADILSLLQNIVTKLDDVQLQSVYDFAMATLQKKPAPAAPVVTTVPEQRSPQSPPKAPAAQSSTMEPTAPAIVDDDDPFGHLRPAGFPESDGMSSLRSTPMSSMTGTNNQGGGAVQHQLYSGMPGQQMKLQPHQQQTQEQNVSQQPSMQQNNPRAATHVSESSQQQDGSQQMQGSLQHAQGQNPKQQVQQGQYLQGHLAMQGGMMSSQQQTGSQQMQGSLQHAQGQNPKQQQLGQQMPQSQGRVMMQGGIMQTHGQQMMQGYGIPQQSNPQMMQGQGIPVQNQQMMQGQGMPYQNSQQMMQECGMMQQNNQQMLQGMQQHHDPQTMQGQGMPAQNNQQMIQGFPQQNNPQMIQGQDQFSGGRMGGGMISNGRGYGGVPTSHMQTAQHQMALGNVGTMPQGGGMQQQQQAMMYQQQQPGMGNQQKHDPFSGF